MKGENRYDQPVAGHFGEHGGRFVAETLMHALEELKEAYFRWRGDEEFIVFERSQVRTITSSNVLECDW